MVANSRTHRRHLAGGPRRRRRRLAAVPPFWSPLSICSRPQSLSLSPLQLAGLGPGVKQTDGGRCCDIITVNQRALVLSLSLRVVVPGRRVVRVPTWVWLPCEPVMAGRPSAGIAPHCRFPLSLSREGARERGVAWRGRGKARVQLPNSPSFLVLFISSCLVTSTATLVRIPNSNPNHYYGLLSTIRSQIRQDSILINLETNYRVENLIGFRKRLNKSNND